MNQYKKAGVDVAKTDKLAKQLSNIVENTGGFEVATWFLIKCLLHAYQLK